MEALILSSGNKLEILDYSRIVLVHKWYLSEQKTMSKRNLAEPKLEILQPSKQIPYKTFNTIFRAKTFRPLFLWLVNY